MEQKPVRAGRRAAGEAALAEKDSLVEIRMVLVSAGLFYCGEQGRPLSAGTRRTRNGRGRICGPERLSEKRKHGKIFGI